MEDIVIIGGGPAGLTAGIYVQRAGKHAVILEANACGGQIINTPNIENYPAIENISGFEFVNSLQKQVENLGAEIRFSRVVGISLNGDTKIVHTDSGDIETRAVIIATGASSRPLGIPNEKDFIGKGVSYCATCDGAFFRKKDVAVVGGGNTAIEDALFLSSYCNKVYVIHRRDEFRAEKSSVDKLKTKTNVEFVLNSNVTALIGEQTLNKIEVTNTNGEKSFIDVSGLFIAIGQTPTSSAFSNLVDINEYGYIKANEDCLTNIEGIYVAGDCRTKTVRQLSTACSDGAIAGLTACNYLNK